MPDRALFLEGCKSGWHGRAAPASFSHGSGVLQAFYLIPATKGRPQLLQAEFHPCFHRPKRRVRDLCDLALAHSLEEGKINDLLLVGWQPVQVLMQNPGNVGMLAVDRRILGERPQPGLIFHPVLGVVIGLGPAQIVIDRRLARVTIHPSGRPFSAEK